VIKNIIFDLGGVILKHKESVTQDIILQLIPSSKDNVMGIWKEYETKLVVGEETSTQFLEEIKSKTNTHLEIQELREKWKSLYLLEANSVDLDLLRLVVFLRKKNKVYLFSDTIDIHDEVNETRGIYDKFDAVYKSFEDGVTKTSGKDAFLFLLRKIGAIPEECLFIDDLEENIKAAREVGIEGIVYKDTIQLKEELRLLGVINE
jgi:HAD superfamily hydrolase (TIGR01509 family)